MLLPLLTAALLVSATPRAPLLHSAPLLHHAQFTPGAGTQAPAPLLPAPAATAQSALPAPYAPSPATLATTPVPPPVAPNLAPQAATGVTPPPYVGVGALAPAQKPRAPAAPPH